MARSDEYLTMRNAQITYLNFAGEERRFNAAGDRNFSIKLEEDEAEAMMKDGWAVKERRSREGELMFYHLPVKVSYKGRSNPILVLVNRKGKTELDEDTADTIDNVVIDNVDLIIRAYHWNVSGKSGVTAYLNEIYVTMYQSDLSAQYENIPDASQWRPMIEGSERRLELGSGEAMGTDELLALETRQMNENAIDGDVVYDSDEEIPY